MPRDRDNHVVATAAVDGKYQRSNEHDNRPIYQVGLSPRPLSLAPLRSSSSPQEDGTRIFAAADGKITLLTEPHHSVVDKDDCVYDRESRFLCSVRMSAIGGVVFVAADVATDAAVASATD